MNFETIEEILGSSKPNDWLYDDEVGIYTYKHDVELNISIRDKIDAKIIDAITILLEKKSSDDVEKAFKQDWESGRFQEEWVKNYPDKNAYRLIVKINYSGAFIKEYLFVYVDGCREIVPAPDPINHSISTFQFNFGRILNRTQNIEEYLAVIKTGRIKMN